MNNTEYRKRIKLSSYDSMFGIDDDPKVKKEETPSPKSNGSEGVIEVPVRDLHTFKNHPFSVMEDEHMDELIESVKQYGVISPCLARKRKEGGYELISGHRRRHAAIKAGLKTVPVIVRNMDDDEAIIVMVDANIQRENLFPSEKAKAYAMKYNALKHQGKWDGNGKRTLEDMSDEAGESMTQIQRYIELAKLSEEMMILLDDGKLKQK